MPHPESEHGLRVQLATALRERDTEREFRGAAEAAFAEQLARTEAAESALAAARREQGELWELLREARLALVHWAETAEMPLLARIEAALAAPGDSK